MTLRYDAMMIGANGVSSSRLRGWLLLLYTFTTVMTSIHGQERVTIVDSS